MDCAYGLYKRALGASQFVALTGSTDVREAVERKDRVVWSILSPGDMTVVTVDRMVRVRHKFGKKKTDASASFAREVHESGLLGRAKDMTENDKQLSLPVLGLSPSLRSSPSRVRGSAAPLH